MTGTGRSLAGAVHDSLFWVTAGRTWPDRLRLAGLWLSPRLRRRTGSAVAVRTRFLGGRPVYLRPGSYDARVFRNLFHRGDYALPEELTGSVSSVADLGAYTGLSTLYFAERHPGARIVAVEADPGNYACLLENVQTLPDPGCVTALHAAVSGATGSVAFRTEGPAWGHSIAADDRGTIVPSVTLPDLLEKFALESVDLLKMDIEGAEAEVFESAPQWLGRVGWILLELHAPAFTLAELLALIGPSGRRAFVRILGPSPGWVDVTDHPPHGSRRDAACLDLAIPPPALSQQLRGARISSVAAYALGGTASTR